MTIVVGVLPDAAARRDRPIRYDSGRPRDGAARTSQRQETTSMAQNLQGAREESAYVLDLIGKKTLTPPEQEKVIEDSVRYWTDNVNPTFLEYRKSVIDRLHGRRMVGRGLRLPRHPGQGVPRHPRRLRHLRHRPPPPEGPEGGPGAARPAGDPLPGADRPAADLPRAPRRDDHAGRSPVLLLHQLRDRVDRGVPEDVDPDHRAAPLRRRRSAPSTASRSARSAARPRRSSASRSCR